MEKIAIVFGFLSAIIQFLRFWPNSFSGLIFGPIFSGFIVWAVCNAGYKMGYDDVYTYNILNNESQYKTWLEWGKGAAKGTAIFLVVYVAFSWYGHGHSRCVEKSDPIYGGCSEYSDELTNKEKGIKFSLLNELPVPLILAFAFNVGSVAGRKKRISFRRNI